jgi:hypothetical protein
MGENLRLFSTCSIRIMKTWLVQCGSWSVRCPRRIGTFEIVNTEDIPARHKVMDMCVSFKIKQDIQGNVIEYLVRFNADGRQQEEGS